jgi:nucleobase:cation symporter-1, NCS1 family
MAVLNTKDTTADPEAVAYTVIERHSIDYIPEAERHGRVRDLASFWFGANTVYSTFATAALMVATGFPFVWSLVAMVLGTVLGTFVAAFHAAQGPKLGLPQMIQSRAQFGYVGAVLPMLIAEVAYIVFFAAGPSLGGIVANSIFGWNIDAMVAILTIASAAVALFGYDTSHLVGKWLALACVIIFGIFTVLLGTHSGLVHPAHVQWSGHGFSLGMFLAIVSLSFTFQAGYGPYVADYARYLPSKSSMVGTGLATSLGIGVSALWMFVLGAYLTDVGHFNTNVTGLFFQVTGSVGGWFSDIAGVVLLLVFILQGSVNMYAGMNTGLSIVDSFRPGRMPRSSRLERFITLIPITGVMMWASYAYAGSFLGTFEKALSVLLVLLVPWSAVNLTDFYLIRRGQYRRVDMFDPHGPYGMVNWRGMLAFVVAFGIELPFANLGFWDGPLSKHWFDTGDMSWLVGLIVGSALYAALCWGMREQSAASDSFELPEEPVVQGKLA